MPGTPLTDSTGITARAAASCAGVLHGPYGLLLGALSAVILYGGWAGLWFVARRYPRATGRRRLLGRWLHAISVITALGTVIAWLFAHTDKCGRAVGAAGDIEAWLFLVTVVSFMLGASVKAHGTQAAEWVAIAAIAIADFGLIPIYMGPHQPHRAAIVVLLLVHGCCTTVAAWWSRQVRSGAARDRAKAAEPGRTLAGGWLALVLLLVAATGEPVTSAVLPDSVLISLFVVAAISTVTGAGYTKYVEAKDGLTEPPEPDTLDRLVTRIRRGLGRPGHWLRACRQRFTAAPPAPAAARPIATTPPIGPDLGE